VSLQLHDLVATKDALAALKEAKCVRRAAVNNATSAADAAEKIKLQAAPLRDKLLVLTAEVQVKKEDVRRMKVQIKSLIELSKAALNCLSQDDDTEALEALHTHIEECCSAEVLLGALVADEKDLKTRLEILDGNLEELADVLEAANAATLRSRPTSALLALTLI